ncbi:MAG: hypothetical protein V4738_08310 [Pseudomonadota bacterium]
MSITDWLTLALVLITTFYAWATFEILRANKSVVQAMQAQTEAQLRPYIVAAVAVRAGTTLLLLEIRNTGKSHAVDVRLAMDKDFFFNGEKAEKNIARMNIFTQPIESLSPGVSIPFVLGVGHSIFANSVDDSICPKVFSITAEYSFAGRRYKEQNIIDLRPLMNSSAEHDPIAEEVKKFRESLEKVLRK